MSAGLFDMMHPAQMVLWALKEKYPLISTMLGDPSAWDAPDSKSYLPPTKKRRGPPALEMPRPKRGTGIGLDLALPGRTPVRTITKKRKKKYVRGRKSKSAWYKNKNLRKQSQWTVVRARKGNKVFYK